MDLRFSLIGLIIGFLIGLTGMGGGALMTPIMILIMGVKPLIAVGTDLAYGAITRIFGGAAHLRQGTVHRRTAYWLSLGSIPSTVLGVGLVAEIKQRDPQMINGLLLPSIAWALILVAIVLALKPIIVGYALAPAEGTPDQNWRERLFSLGERRPWVLAILGAFVGFMVGLTSVGAGSLIVVGLLFLYPRWQSKELVGTDVFHATLLTGAAALAQGFAGNINIPMMVSLLLGSIPGVLIGSRLAVGFPERALRLSMAGVLLVSGAKLL